MQAASSLADVHSGYNRMVCMFSIIIPAHNEAVELPETLAHAFAAARAQDMAFEVLVVDDASTDATATLARDGGARVVSVNHRQIGATRNAGARAARGRVLVFVDADTRLHARTLHAALRAVDAGAIGGGSAVRFEEPVSAWARWSVSMWNALAHALGWAAGCFVFVDRRAFEAVGGFDERYFAAEEIVLSRALRRRGRFVILRETVTTSARKTRTVASMAPHWRVLWKIITSRGSALHRRDELGLWYEQRKEP